MNTFTPLWFLASVVVLISASRAPAALDPRTSVRINRATMPLLITNRPSPMVTVATTNQTLKVKISAHNTLLVRKGNTFTKAVPSRREGTNEIYDLKPTDVYVARGSPSSPLPLSTNGASLPDAVRAVVDGHEVEGRIEVALQSERMVLNPSTHQFEGLLGLCFRSASPAALVQKLLPLTLRLQTTPGLQLATNTVVLNSVGNAGCRDIPIQSSAERTDAKITVKSDAVGEQDFTIQFDQPPAGERYKDLLIILGGIALGALGGLVRTWHPPRVKEPWKRVATGAFCGLVLVLLGQIGVQRFFHIEGPVTTSVILGLCGILGYLGVRMFELFAPKESDPEHKRSDGRRPRP